MNPQEQSVLPPELSQPQGSFQHTVVVPPREEGAPTEDVIPLEETPIRKHTGRPRDTVFAIAVSALVTGAVAGGAFLHGVNTRPPVEVSVASVVATVPSVPVPESRNPFYGVTLEARAAVVYDIHDKKFLFMQNEHTKRSLASLTKIMTGVVAGTYADDGRRVAIPPSAIQAEGDSGLYANETWKLKDLISFVLMTSSNDGAEAVAAVIGMTEKLATTTSPAEGVDAFVADMNRHAQELGLLNTSFTNPTGLDEMDGTLGGEGTASDMAKLVAYAWREFPETLANTAELVRTYTSEDGFVHDAENTNKQVYSYPGLLGSKTGYTDYAGGNLAVVYDAGLNHPIVVVVLGSSLEGRFTDVRKLIDATSEYMESGWYAYESAHLSDVQ